MRRAAKVDGNHTEIVQALRSVGATVQSLAAVGGGVPDLLVGWRGMNLLIEVKDGSRIPSQQRLTPEQVKWHEAWGGRPVFVVRTVDETLEVLKP
jgi:Holliday junction resolvase